VEIKEGKIKGVFEILLKPILDERGFFMRTFDEEIFKENNIPFHWVQENHTKSVQKNTIRGLHFINAPNTDGKLIRCTRGKVIDVFVDLRLGSPTQGTWESVILSEDDFKWLYLPKGFAHGFCTLENNTEMEYKHDHSYQKGFDSGIKFDDSDLKINWPVESPIISDKDKNLMSYKEFIEKFKGL
jgi:dTDP-4-dehydrorhamnose 3,5-epimerase